MEPEGFLQADGRRLEYRWFGPQPQEAPTLVFLHEGLGCVSMWKDFPDRVVAATGLGALVYSRAGYGKSDPAELPRSLRYMHDEGLIVLPQILKQTGIKQAILVGHSDGGSIAIICAGGNGASCVQALILLAPHVFTEELNVKGIRAAAHNYRTTNLREKLARYHGERVDEAFWGWNDIWLHPDFWHWNIEEYLPAIRLPTLLIQGQQDQYGTRQQLTSIESQIGGPVRRVMLADCGHSPHQDQAEVTVAAMVAFVRGLGSQGTSGESTKTGR